MTRQRLILTIALGFAFVMGVIFVTFISQKENVVNTNETNENANAQLATTTRDNEIITLRHPDGSQSLYTIKSGQVFYNGSLIKEADVESFRVLAKFDQPGGSDEYAIDVNNVYFMSFIVEGADPTSFSVLDRLNECNSGGVYSAFDSENKFLQDNKICE